MFGKAAERQNMRCTKMVFCPRRLRQRELPRSLCAAKRPRHTIRCAVCSMQCGRSTMLKQRLWLRTGSCQCRTVPLWPVTSRTSTGAWAVIHSWTSSVGTENSPSTHDHALMSTILNNRHIALSRAASPLWLRQAQQALNTQQAAHMRQAVICR